MIHFEKQKLEGLSVLDPACGGCGSVVQLAEPAGDGGVQSISDTAAPVAANDPVSYCMGASLRPDGDRSSSNLDGTGISPAQQGIEPVHYPTGGEFFLEFDLL